MLTITKRARSANRAPRRGSTFTTVAVLSPVLMGFAAMGVDWGMVAVTQHQVQAAADAAALAATTEMNDIEDAQTIAEAYLERVLVNERPVALEGITYGNWDGNVFTPGDASPNAVRVQAMATVDMPFAAILGLSTVTVRAEAGAGPRVTAKRAPDIVMVLDVTRSMELNEVQAERDAAEAMLDCINANATPDSRVSIVTFGGLDAMLADMTEMQAGGYDTLYEAADDIVRCDQGGAPCTATNHASGYESALRILEDADTPEGVGQAILFMSDGYPQLHGGGICHGQYYDMQDDGDVKFDITGHCDDLGDVWVPGRRGRPGRWEQSQPEIVHYTAWADAAKAEALAADIDTYTVFYGADAWQEGGQYMQDHILVGDDAFHGHAYTRADITEKFVDVCQAYTVGNAGLYW